MSPDRQIVRLMAAVILAIIAYVAPSAVQAHEGHAHHGHYVAAAQPEAAPAPASAVATTPAKPAVRSEASASLKIALAAVEPARIEADREGGCCPGPCKTRCCGPMACCATGILSGPYALSPALFRTVALIPRDVSSRVGTGPEALPEPPRTLA
ncbi:MULTISPECIES: hypothetical protein [Methylobacterium]|uniref:hypothetical protein n=1 Tax=Methylobacterium TaxID=407 RepID=UPI002F348A58